MVQINQYKVLVPINTCNENSLICLKFIGIGNLQCLLPCLDFYVTIHCRLYYIIDLLVNEGLKNLKTIATFD